MVQSVLKKQWDHCHGLVPSLSSPDPLSNRFFPTQSQKCSSCFLSKWKQTVTPKSAWIFADWDISVPSPVIKDLTIKLHSVLHNLYMSIPRINMWISGNPAKINIYHENVFYFILCIMHLSKHGDFLFQPGIHNGTPPKKETWLWRTFVFCLIYQEPLRIPDWP